MASCMECIHFNPCNTHGNIIVEKPTEGNDWSLHNKVENECKYFKPTADVVEVVRCKDCEYWQDKNSKRTQGVCLCGEKDMNYGGEFYPFANDFCSYGKPRTPKERGGEK